MNCRIPIQNNFDTVISLQPIAGFGNKSLTNQESEYAKSGKSYSKNSLLESLPVYQNYAENLSEIMTCAKTVDLRDVFDENIKTWVPLRREQKPQDIGYLAAFLASDYSKNITGQAINIDGGIYMN